MGPCSVEKCDRIAHAAGLCAAHYLRQHRYGDVSADRRRKATGCEVEGCEAKHVARGFCAAHYRRLRLYGDPQGVPESARNGQPSGRQVDRKGYVQWYWPEHANARGDGKIAEHVMVTSERLGRALLPTENVHHRNGVRDDNRIENLELWSRCQPPGKRVRDLVEYANQIRSQYGSDPTQYP